MSGYDAATKRMTQDQMREMENGATTASENMMHMMMQGRDRPDNHAASLRSYKRLRSAPSTETRYFTGLYRYTSVAGIEGQVGLTSFDQYIPYSTTSLNARSKSRIHLKSLKLGIFFKLKGTRTPYNDTVVNSVWTQQVVRLIVVHRPYGLDAATGIDYGNQLLSKDAVAGVLNSNDMMYAGYNQYNISSFRVLFDQYIALCPPGTTQSLKAVTTTAAYNPYYSPDYNLSLETYINLQGMQTEYPYTAVGGTSKALTGGLQMFLITQNQDVGATENRTVITTNFRIGFVDC